MDSENEQFGQFFSVIDSNKIIKKVTFYYARNVYYVKFTKNSY